MSFNVNVNLMSIYFMQGVGEKVHTRELMSIASGNDDHLIIVKKYKTLQKAIQKAFIKIGTSKSLSSIFFFYFASNFYLERMFNLKFLQSTQNFSWGLRPLN